MKKLFVVLSVVTAVVAVVLVRYSQNLKKRYQQAVLSELERAKALTPDLLTEADVDHLPEAVKKYIRYTGFVGKAKIVNFRSAFRGGIRFKPDEEYMPLQSVQYNFTDIHARLFFIVAKKKGIPAIGLHLYRNAKAIFLVKLLGLFTVVDAAGPKMDQGETVTVLNDLFFMAPGALIDKRIQWQTVEEKHIKALFTNGSITVGADVYFDDEGKLVNFISNDRFETNGKEYINNPWETPVSAYREINGYRLPSKAQLIYRRPEGNFCYGEFELENMEYNCKELK